MPTFNLVTFIISIVSIVILFLVKHFVNMKYKEKLIAPIPIELIVILLGTLFSKIFDFNGRYKVKIVGHIPLGFINVLKN
jgi:MFS superfamily sulfate permease-like transporter